MQVIVKKAVLERLIEEAVNEERSFHSKNANELEKASPPIFPQMQMAQQLSTSAVPVDDPAFVPTNRSELGKAAMQLTQKIDDPVIEAFYNNFKNLIKKYEDSSTLKTSTTHSIGEAKLPQFLGNDVEEPAFVPRKSKGGKAERDIGLISSTPEEDDADIQGAVDVPSSTRAPDPDAVTKKRKSAPTRVGASDGQDNADFTALYLSSLGDIGPQPAWLKNIEISLSDSVVGDANKLLAAITKKIGEENVTPESLEAALDAALAEMTLSMLDSNMVFSVPSYGTNFTYNTEGKKKNLFSLEQYKEVFRSLASQQSIGTQYADSWGQKYAKAIRALRYASNDAALRDALFVSLPVLQRTLTDAVIDSYPPNQTLINPKDVANKLYIINDDVIDKFVSQGLNVGRNTRSIEVAGKDVTVTIDIPDSPAALQAIEDTRFGGLLAELLSIAPAALEDYISKKQRAKRSAVQMTRGEENYFYDMGMKIGGPNFKMSAQDFQAKIAAAAEVVESEGLEITDEQLVSMVLLSGGVLDEGQFELLSTVKDYLWDIFSNATQGNVNLQKQFGGIDKLFELIPEELSAASRQVLEVFDDFCERAIKAFADKTNNNRLFDIYDSVVDNPATKAYFKSTAGVKHSQIYDQPGAARRAKDVSNLVGNLRHIAIYMMDNAKSLRRGGSTLGADRMLRDAKQLVDPTSLLSTMQLFVKAGKSPLLAKAVEAAAKELMKYSLESLTPAPDAQSFKITTLAAQRGAGAERTATQDSPRKFASNDVAGAIDDIIAAYSPLDAVKKEAFISEFDVALEDGPSPYLRNLYPALKTAQDYQRLVDQLMQLNESGILSLITKLIREHTRR